MPPSPSPGHSFSPDKRRDAAEKSDSIEDRKEAKLNLIVAATAEAVTMVEGEGKEASEEEMVTAAFADLYRLPQRHQQR